MTTAIYLTIVTYLLTLNVAEGLDNGLALTPPMGWLSWERYRCITDCQLYPYECISEWLFRNVTDLIVSGRFKDAGYEYVIIDGCWLAKTRDGNGKLQPDPERFPSGVKALSDYIHSKGLKFGIFEVFGTQTCGGYPGIIGHMELDAKTFAEWNVDYVKLGGCDADPETMDVGYPEFGNYLKNTGRPMVYSCSWPFYQEFANMEPNFKAIAEHCNLWRNYGDVEDSWDSVMDIMDYFGKNQDIISEYAGPGHWNDPDMLVIGNYGLSQSQAEVQMAVWAILAAPLLMSTDLANIQPEFKAILLNKPVIAINQDPLGIPGRRVLTEDDIHVWTRPISPVVQTFHSYAVAFVNLKSYGGPYTYETTLKKIGLNNPNGYKITNLFSTMSTHMSDEVLTTSDLKVRIKPSGVEFLKLTAISSSEVKII